MSGTTPFGVLRISSPVAVVAVLLALAASPAGAQTAASVTRVIDGDTVEATLTGGQQLTVRLIGIDTPETKRPGVPVECGGPEASDALRELVEGRTVTLTPDPSQDTVDRYGRSLFYVDRDDGVDVGLQLIRRGWAETYQFADRFERQTEYERAEDDASGGVWRLCDGRFHIGQAEQQRESAKAFVKLYYRRISNRQFLGAWSMLGARRKAQVRPYWRWKTGYRGSLGVSVLAATARLAGPRRAVVKVRLRSRDRDVCSHRIVRQTFAGNVIVAPHRDAWLIIKFQMRKTGGATPRLSKSDCAPPPPPPPDDGDDGDGGGNCDPNYSGCLDPNASDYDCAGGAGNGPLYTGPVQVYGDDHYGLDNDGDGVGCEDS